jgi:hypothetical protein
MNLVREVLDGADGVLDLLADGGLRSEGGMAEPVMADHAFFVGIGDGAMFEIGHAGEGFLHARFHGGKKIIREVHAADVQGQAESGVMGKILLVTFPQRFGCRFHNAPKNNRE